MAIQITKWSPDTCGCVLHYQWDDSVPADQRIHTPIDSYVGINGQERTVKCNLHTAVAVLSNLHNTVIDENSRKEKVRQKIIDNFPALTTTDANGNTILKPNIFSWSFDDSRVLNVTISGITTQQKSTAQTVVNNFLGSGKVLIN